MHLHSCSNGVLKCIHAHSFNLQKKEENAILLFFRDKLKHTCLYSVLENVLGQLLCLG